MKQNRFILRMAIGALGVSLAASQARAVVRFFFAPADSRAIVLLQGPSTETIDPDARALYDKMAVSPTPAPGGQGKGVKSAPGDFNMSCVAREAIPGDAACSFVVAKSARSSVSAAARKAEFALSGQEAAEFYRLLAGSGATEPFTFANADGQIAIDARGDRFLFKFQAR